MPPTAPLRERFESKYTAGAEDECWEWQASTTAGGYGQIARGRPAGKHLPLYAHRLAWEYARGPIPPGFTIDHLCRNRRCVNPAHLEPVTMTENLRRGESPPARNARKTHCDRGHPYNTENTYYYRTGRLCRVCRRITWRQRKEARGYG